MTVREDGFRGLAKGWAPTFVGYSLQGLGKFGFYEVFKILYANMLGEVGTAVEYVCVVCSASPHSPSLVVSFVQENAYQWRTSLYLAASASAEFFADIALAPWEALKVRIQTQPGWANTMREGLPKLYRSEGLWGYAKSGCEGHNWSQTRVPHVPNSHVFISLALCPGSTRDCPLCG